MNNVVRQLEEQKLSRGKFTVDVASVKSTSLKSDLIRLEDACSQLDNMPLATYQIILHSKIESEKEV